MNNLLQAIWVEFLKIRSSPMPLLTLLGFSLAPLVGGFFMIILKDPELARRVGVVSDKAQMLSGAADWTTYLGLVAQASALGGIILYSFIASWVFGREYSDHTLKDLLALPTPRQRDCRRQVCRHLSVGSGADPVCVSACAGCRYGSCPAARLIRNILARQHHHFANRAAHHPPRHPDCLFCQCRTRLSAADGRRHACRFFGTGDRRHRLWRIFSMVNPRAGQWDGRTPICTARMDKLSYRVRYRTRWRCRDLLLVADGRPESLNRKSL